MNDFDYDVLQKKRVAAGARHRVNGSKSKYCGLPSDRLSAAELKKRNGECRSFRMDAPCTWEQFKVMPDDLKQEYVTRLQELYGANNTMLGEMWGVSNVTVYAVLKRIGVASGGVNRSRMPRKEREIATARWSAFCNGVVGGSAKSEEPETPDETPTIRPDEMGGTPSGNEIPQEDADTEKKPETEELAILRQVMELEGTITAESLARAIASMTTPGSRCRIRIEVEAL